jgi:hypothetical protein
MLRKTDYNETNNKPSYNNMPTQLDFQIQQRLGLPIDQVARFCQHWHIIELYF